MFIIKFLQSLVIPSKMARYRKMNFLIAIGVFIISSGLLALPNSIYISKHRYDLVDAQDSYNLALFTKISAEDLLILQNSTCSVEKQYLDIEDPSAVQMGSPYIFALNYQEKAAELYVVFDIYDLNDPEVGPIYNIQSNFNTLPESETDRYIIVFYPDGVYFGSPQFRKELKYAKDKDFTFASLTSGKDLAYRLIDMYMPDIRLELTFNTFLMCVIYPLIFIILMWLIYKTTQTPYTFKEMYNLGAISSLLPLVLIIILAFIFPAKALIYYYISAFGLYYIIVLYFISKKKKIA